MGRPAATLRAEGGCGRSLRRLSSTMSRHRLLLAPQPRLANPRRKHHRIYGREHLVEPRDTNHGQARRRRCPASPERPSRVQLFPCRVRHTRSWDLRSGQGSDHRGSLRHLHVDWLHIKYLWVTSDHRKQGLGSKLMSLAEEEAQNRQCLGLHLDTFSFQALDFYLGLGFEVFGEIKDHPEGGRRYFLSKRL